LPGKGWIINTGGCETGPAVPKPGNADIVYANCKGRFSVYQKSSGIERRYDVGAANMYGHNPAELKYRFQRVAPIHISPHDSQVIYHTSQYVHKTNDEGKSWEIISPDLTAFDPEKQVISGTPLTRDITGEEFYSTIYSIQESKISKGLIWVGANDGPVHMTKNGGKSWTNVTPKTLPAGGRVDAIEPSIYQEGKAYISVLRYQLGDWKPYVYKTSDFGQSWNLLTDGKNGIPIDFPVRVIREDPYKEGVLYAGTEYGLYISFNEGENWSPFQQNLPIVPITDIKIHRGDLVISTMGRGFWLLDNIYSLSGLKDFKIPTTQLLPIKKTIRYRHPKVRENLDTYPEYPKPSLIIDYVLKKKPKKPIRLDIYNEDGDKVITLVSKLTAATKNIEISDMHLNTITYFEDYSLSVKRGLNRFHWDFKHEGIWDEDSRKTLKNGPLISPGKYKVVLTVEENKYEQIAKILPGRIYKRY